MADYASAQALLPGLNGKAASKDTDDKDFLATARDRFQITAEYESEYRRLALDDLRFYDGEQWPSNIKTQRELDHRPCITINRLPQFTHQVTNNLKQLKAAPKVSPVDAQGDKKTAEVLQGLLRHIEVQSNADAARSYAAFYAAVTGRGWYRVVTKYIEGLSFDQEIYVQRIKNPNTVYMDPTCQQPDYSDARFAFIVEDLTEEAYKERYPDEDLVSAEDYRSHGDNEPLWRWEGGIRIAEYFCRHTRQETIVLLRDGTILPLEQAPEGAPVIRKRTMDVPYVEWCVINGEKVLERAEWPGKYIPLVGVLGEEYDVDGKVSMVGMVRHAKDAQRMLNYWESSKTEIIALAPKAPFIVAEGQIENHEKEWSQANAKTFAYLQYKPKSVGQEMVPPPQRQVYEPPIQSITVAQAQTVDHLKATTGVYDASLGNRSNETTGVAIKARQLQGDVANYHFTDNLQIAITHETRILIDLIPKIYDRPGRVIRIIGSDGAEKQVPVGMPHNDQGFQRLYDFGMGQYDVVADVGPSYKTKREESVDGMVAFAQVAPELVPQYADLFVEAQDWPMAEAIAERVRPPNIPPKGEEQLPPAAMQKINQLQQQNQQLTEALQQATDALNVQKVQMDATERMQMRDIQSKAALQQQKLETDKLRDMAKNRVTVATTESKTDSQESIAQLDAETRLITERMKLSGKANGQDRPPLSAFEEED